MRIDQAENQDLDLDSILLDHRQRTPRNHRSIDPTQFGLDNLLLDGLFSPGRSRSRSSRNPRSLGSADVVTQKRMSHERYFPSFSPRNLFCR